MTRTHHRQRWLLAASVVASVIVACGSSGQHDAAVEVSPGDAAPDAAPETAADSPTDTAADAPSDTASGIAPDAPSGVVAEAVVVASNVTTLAGSGTAGFADGTGVAASFDFPSGVAVDASGNVYVTDRDNHRIRKVTATGVVTTLAGSGLGSFADGTGVAASFNYPWALAIDASGNLYVADRYNHRIRKVTAAGVVTTVAGSDTVASVDGTGAAASFTTPSGVAVDAAGNLYVSDVTVDAVNSNRIRKVTAGGVVTTLAGSDVAGFADGTGAAAMFDNPQGVAVDAAGTLYVADEHNHRIRRVTAAGVVTTLAGSGVGGLVDGTGSAAGFFDPVGVAVDAAGNIYVGGFYDSHIRRVTTAGVVTTLAGSDAGGFSDGPGPDAGFNYPYGVAVDAARNVYVGDYYNHRIRKVATVGIGQLAVTWSVPSLTGTSAVTGYTASAITAGGATQTCTTTGATSCTISGLTSGVAYGVSVTATNAAGKSAPSGSTKATPN